MMGSREDDDDDDDDDLVGLECKVIDGEDSDDGTDLR
jgi:hypothetical protein